MEKTIVTPSDLDKVVFKIANDHAIDSNIDYCKHIFQKLDFAIDLTDSLHRQRIEMEERLVWIEPMIFKFSLHTNSLLTLFSGTKMKIKGRDLKVFDEPSTIVLFRVILENYLTFYYLFCDSITQEEKEFRMNVWKYSGLKQRNGFIANTEDSQMKKANELLQMEALKGMVSNSVFFKGFNKKQQEIILDGKKPRLFNSWGQLNLISNFQTDMFKTLYGYKSNYTHSEFISMLQIKSGNFGFNPNAKNHYTLFLLHSLVCKLIIDLTGIFPSVKQLFRNSDSLLIKEVELLNDFSMLSTEEEKNK